jgi:putative Mg2+ transporter-C (MgtC) family protein
MFEPRDAVRGLTTAATIWLTRTISMAWGGGLPILALAVTALHCIVAWGYPLSASFSPVRRPPLSRSD